MAHIKTKAGTEVTLGRKAGRTSWGDPIKVVDAGVPLSAYNPTPVEPSVIWRTQPALRKVVSYVARQVGAIPWHAFQRVSDTDRKRLANSPAEKIMSHPSPMTSGYNLWERLTIDKLIYDICLAVYVDGELVRIPPSMVRIKSDAVGRPREVLIETPRGMPDLDVTEVPKILTWGWSATGAGGVSPMHTLAETLNENLRSVQWRTKQWENTPKISGILKRPAGTKWDAQAKDSFLEVWRTWRDGLSFGTPILEDGMEYEPLEPLSAQDLQGVEGRQLSDAEVASFFHIAPELVGARPGNFSNVSAWRQMLYGPTLGPLFTEFEQAVKVGRIVETVDPTEGVYLVFNREAAMAGSFMDQARLFQTLTGGPVMTRAEARQRLDLPHIEGTDELIVPLNVIEGGQASPTDSGDQNIGGDNAAPENREGAGG